MSNTSIKLRKYQSFTNADGAGVESIAISARGLSRDDANGNNGSNAGHNSAS